MGKLVKPTVTKCCEIPKGWGKEMIITNNQLYCGKILMFKKGCKFSMHYHLIKDETWFIAEGEFLYRWIDTETADIYEEEQKPGDVVRQLPGQPHQLMAHTDGSIIEVSTEHFDDDSYRVSKGDSQKNEE